MARFDVIKGKSALQVSVIPTRMKSVPSKSGGTFEAVDREGAVLLEFAMSTGSKNEAGNDLYDWKNKINFAVGINDICAILGFYTGWKLGLVPWDKRANVRLVHVPPGKAEADCKTLTISNGVRTDTKDYTGTFQVELSVPTESKKVMVPFSLGEMEVFCGLLSQASLDLTGLSNSMVPVSNG